MKQTRKCVGVVTKLKSTIHTGVVTTRFLWVAHADMEINHITTPAKRIHHRQNYHDE